MRKLPHRTAPKARTRGLVIKKLADEVLVYDLETDKAHCLNVGAALVWEHCDGRRTAREIAGLVEAGTAEPFTEEMVWLALHQLECFSLLEEAVRMPRGASAMTRREMAKRLGLATAASLPLILSIVAPEAASAATCGGTGARCLTNARCCSGICINGTCACLGQNTNCTSDVQCCSGRCGSALNKCLP